MILRPLPATNASKGMQRMLLDNNLVRRLEACETMGGATSVCCDKTGTLTHNAMSVTKLWIGCETLPSSALKSSTPRLRELVQQAVALNSTASIGTDLSGKEVRGAPASARCPV